MKAFISKPRIMISVVFLLLSSQSLFAQQISSEAQGSKVLSKEEVVKLEAARLENIKQQEEFSIITNEIAEQYVLIRKLEIKNFPFYPELISNETLSNYLEELKKLTGASICNSSKQ